MIRLAAAIAIAVLSALPALAEEPGQGVIQGEVVNGTEGGGSVAGLEVTLTGYRGEAEAGTITALTDAEGKFQFSGLATAPEYSYQVSTVYQEAEYFGDTLQFAQGEASKSMQLIVYEATTSDEAIGIAMSHAILYVEQDSILVVEYVIFMNQSDRTYVGSREVEPGRKETLRFSLPEEATDLEYGRGLMECCAFPSGGGFVDTMAVEPGAKEVAYLYRLKPSSSRYLFTKVADYPVANFDLLIQGEGLQVSSDELVSQGTVQMDGTPFLHLTGEGFPEGTPITATIDGLPYLGDGISLKWAALGLLVLAIGFGFSYPLMRRRLRPVTLKGSPEATEKQLLLELSRLDDEFEAGAITEEEYRRKRSQKKAQLMALMSRAKRKG